MQLPDFAHTTLDRLVDKDLQFLIENFPKPGRSYEEIAQLLRSVPVGLESALNNEALFNRIRDHNALILQISPFLFFSVLLRRSLLDKRIIGDKHVVNYIANLLSLFIKTDRVHRYKSDARSTQYLTDLIQDATDADERERFLIYAHIGNYSLYLTGLFPQYIEYRHRFKRRPVNTQFYVDFGREYYDKASSHALAREYSLDEVFFRLSIMFEVYKDALNHLARQYLTFS